MFAVRRHKDDGLIHSQRRSDGAYRPLKDVGYVGVSGNGLLEIGEQCERLPLLCEFVAKAGHRIVKPENLAAELVYVTTVVLDFASKTLVLVAGGFGHGKPSLAEHAENARPVEGLYVSADHGDFDSGVYPEERDTRSNDALDLRGLFPLGATVGARAARTVDVEGEEWGAAPEAAEEARQFAG